MVNISDLDAVFQTLGGREGLAGVIAFIEQSTKDIRDLPHGTLRLPSEVRDSLGLYLEMAVLGRQPSGLTKLSHWLFSSGISDELRAALSERASRCTALKRADEAALSAASLAKHAYKTRVNNILFAMPPSESDASQIADLACVLVRAISSVFAINVHSVLPGEYPEPNIECFYDTETRTLLVDAQIPHLEFERVEKKELADSAFRSYIAGFCRMALRQLIVREANPLIARIALNGYIVKGRIMGTGLRRDYVVSVCVTDDNADALFQEGAPPQDTLVRMDGRISSDPANDKIAVIVPSPADRSLQASGRPSELSPVAFEQLVATIFEMNGCQVQITQASRDGGVDCIAIDPRPLVGGTILIQAKRYSGTVDVSVVRDLYGLVISKGAAKGVIITTGSFGPSSLEFVRGKPLELVDGAALARLIVSMETSGKLDTPRSL